MRPLLTTKLRVPIRSKAILVRQNIPDEHKPCAIISTKHPEAPPLEPTMIPPITKLMCATEEYATNLFVSVWRRQTNLIIEPPARLIAIQT
jgi:hypothetical protein